MRTSCHNAHVFDEGLFQSFREGRLESGRRGVVTNTLRDCVLVQGLPQVGKTTLLNALLGGHFFPYFLEQREQAARGGSSDDQGCAKPSVVWRDVPVDLSMALGDQETRERHCPFSVPPFLGSTTTTEVVGALWLDRFSPAADDCPPPRAPIRLHIPFPATKAPHPRVADESDRDFVVVMNDSDPCEQEPASQECKTERHAACCFAVAGAMERTVAKMAAPPPFVVMSAAPAQTTTEVSTAPVAAAAGSEVCREPSTVVAPNSEVHRMTFMESQEIADRPPMHRVHTVIYVVDEAMLSAPSSTEFRTSVLATAAAALTSDGTHIHTMLVINRRSRQKQAMLRTQEEYAREFRLSEGQVYVLDLRAALAVALLPNAELHTPRGVGVEMHRMRSRIARTHATECAAAHAHLRQQHCPSSADRAPVVKTASGRVTSSASTAPPTTYRSEESKVVEEASTQFFRLCVSGPDPPTRQPYVPVVLREEFKREDEACLRAAADALVLEDGDQSTCASTAFQRLSHNEYHPKILDLAVLGHDGPLSCIAQLGTAGGTAPAVSPAYIPRVVRDDSHERLAAEHHERLSTYVPRVMRH